MNAGGLVTLSLPVLLSINIVTGLSCYNFIRLTSTSVRTARVFPSIELLHVTALGAQTTTYLR